MVYRCGANLIKIGQKLQKLFNKNFEMLTERRNYGQAGVLWGYEYDFG